MGDLVMIFFRMLLKGLTCIVSGGTSGLGHATAKRLAAAHANVVYLGRNPPKDEIKNAHFMTCDITKESDIKSVVGETNDRFGDIRAVVNCAGIVASSGKVPKLSIENFQQALMVNTVGTYALSKISAESMIKNTPDDDGQRGVIIHTSSIAAYESQVGQVAYAASKGAVNSMALAMARDLSGSAIRCNTIAPGIFDTPMMDIPQEMLDKLCKSVPNPSRLGDPDEFARLVEYLISNNYINGETIRLDGALRMSK